MKPAFKIFYFLILFYNNNKILSVIAIDPSCDYYQEMQLGQEYFIYNKQYPQYYQHPTACRFNAASPLGTVIVMSCNDVQIPYSPNCRLDQLLVSLTGDQNFNDAQKYCGTTIFSLVSRRNALTVGLFSSFQSTGGRFVCSLAAMRVVSNGCTCSPHNEQDKIVGGRNTKANEFPWMTAIMYTNSDIDFCGASIISNQYALTAAHCLRNRIPSSIQIQVGDHDLHNKSETFYSARYDIISFYRHPWFQDDKPENYDIAVLKTRVKIWFNPGVAPVCLPFLYGTTIFDGVKVKVLGWGFTDFAGHKANILQEANLTVVTNTYCQYKLGEEVNPTHICTHENGADSCISDSGGPVLWKDFRSVYQLIGLISYGRACATDIPAVNTKVTSFLSWIASVTSDAEFCIR